MIISWFRPDRVLIKAMLSAKTKKNVPSWTLKHDYPQYIVDASREKETQFRDKHDDSKFQITS